MERDERYEVNAQGGLVVGKPETLTSTERKRMLEKMFSVNGWKYTLLSEVSPAHFHIKLENENIGAEKELHVFHGNVRKEDPERNREEKKIQLGTDNDPRQYPDNSIILGFYVFEDKTDLDNAVVVAWPIEMDKNYPMNPSLRVNMRTDILPAKNNGFYVDKTTGKNLVVFRPSFIYHYLENYKGLQYNTATAVADEETEVATTTERAKFGANKIFYGAPGCGKSRHVSDMLKEASVAKDNIIRVTFHPEYANCDFIGQILPTVETKTDEATGEEKEIVKYIFNPGPFTLALQTAYDTNNMVFLIVEEVNRGNAAAIFGDMFQLLDRVKDSGKPNYCASEYPVSNPNMQKYLIESISDEAIKAELQNGVFVPSNLTIYATMNSSDQNVFTLDTAFKRRWSFEQISNDIIKDTDHKFKGWFVPGTAVTWADFLTNLNIKILDYKIQNQTNEDKRLGKYFVTKDCLVDPANIPADVTEIAQNFAYKVFEYVWNDVCKIGREDWFDTEKYRTLEDLIDAFVNPKEGESPLSVFQNVTF